MTPTTKNRSGVIQIVNMAKAYNSEIGNSEEHYYNENFRYSVLLSINTAITMSQEIAENQ